MYVQSRALIDRARKRGFRRNLFLPNYRELVAIESGCHGARENKSARLLSRRGSHQRHYEVLPFARLHHVQGHADLPEVDKLLGGNNDRIKCNE